VTIEDDSINSPTHVVVPPDEEDGERVDGGDKDREERTSSPQPEPAVQDVLLPAAQQEYAMINRKQLDMIP
jgi:hypothetical protein